MSAVPSEATFDEYFNEQLIACLNVQTNVIQNLGQYSQLISLQLIEIKSDVEILENRVVNLQQQQEQQSYFVSPVQTHLPPPLLSDPFFFLRPPFHVPPPTNKPFFPHIPDLTTTPALFLSSTATHEQLSRDAPFMRDSMSSSIILHPADETEDENESDGVTVPFKPIVHLLPVETKTGEEDEDILFCERAKLYRFDISANEMKERGTGEMKILQHRTTKVCRILMRREQVLKVCANHMITPQMGLKPHQGNVNAYIWSAMDFTDGITKHETLCVKFKTDEQAKRFFDMFNKAKEIQEDTRDKFPSLRKILLNDDDVIVIGEMKPTKEQIERAKRLQLPLTFYLYENREPCRGCRGCREDSPSILSNEIQYGSLMNSYDAATVALLENLANFPSGFFPTSSLPSLMSIAPTWFPDGVDSLSPFDIPSPPKDYRMIVKAKRSLPTNRVPPPLPPPSLLPSHSDYEQISSASDDVGDEIRVVQAHQKKSRNFSGNNNTNTETFSLDNYASQLAQTILDRVKQELYKQMQIVTTNEDKTLLSHFDKNKPSIFANSTTTIFDNLASVKPDTSGFPFTSFDSSPSLPVTGFQFSIPSSASAIDTSSLFTFGNKPKLSYADLAKQSSDNPLTTNDADKRIFPGQGSLIFSTNSTDLSSVEQNPDDDNDAEDSYEPTITFKPIVHLLPVETKTGEEDEDILFCERAKLYRFDTSTNEMKERGTGEMKILQHRTTKVCRILMRREQVLKVCANHKITSQMELKEHQGKENAYIWTAMDFADGVLKQEILCIKFKQGDQAKRFYQQFNDAKQINSTIQQ